MNPGPRDVLTNVTDHSQTLFETSFKNRHIQIVLAAENESRVIKLDLSVKTSDQKLKARWKWRTDIDAWKRMT